jgi:hypothetical protein
MNARTMTRQAAAPHAAAVNRKEFKPVSRRLRLAALAVAIIVSALLLDGVASISNRYEVNGSALARQAQPAQVAQASTESGDAQR